MAYSIYENIDYDASSMVHAFVTPIESSAFHWHEEYEILGVLKGSVGMHIQSEERLVKEGEFILTNPNEIHEIQNPQGQENLCMILQLRPELFHLSEKDTSEIRFYVNDPEDEPEPGFAYFYRQAAAIAYESLSEEAHAPFHLRALVYKLAADLLDYVVHDVRYKDNLAVTDRDTMIRTLDYINGHMDQEDLLDQICYKEGMSRKTLDRCAKSVLGMSMKELVDSLRVEKAKNLLKNTEKNMNYILDVCGFGSEKTFYRKFHAMTGQTPGEFREKGQSQQNNDVLKGYLDFSIPEARAILHHVLEAK